MRNPTSLLVCCGVMFFALCPSARAEEPKVYKDWIVGCDNWGDCQAASLSPEEEGDHS